MSSDHHHHHHGSKKEHKKEKKKKEKKEKKRGRDNDDNVGVISGGNTVTMGQQPLAKLTKSDRLLDEEKKEQETEAFVWGAKREVSHGGGILFGCWALFSRSCFFLLIFGWFPPPALEIDCPRP